METGSQKGSNTGGQGFSGSSGGTQARLADNPVSFVELFFLLTIVSEEALDMKMVSFGFSPKQLVR